MSIVGLRWNCGEGRCFSSGLRVSSKHMDHNGAVISRRRPHTRGYTHDRMSERTVKSAPGPDRREEYATSRMLPF